jgi:hypothetical protein
MQNIRTLVLVTSIAVLTACGGGGGGGGENTPEPTPTPTPVAATPAPAATPTATPAPAPAPVPAPIPSFAGAYFITSNLTTNSCNLAISSTATGSDSVAQNGRDVSYTSGSFAMPGTVDADNGGFTASGTQVSSGVSILTTVNFRAASGGTYSANLTFYTNNCTIVYTGTATKI